MQRAFQDQDFLGEPVDRNAKFKLTQRDIEAVKGATLGTHGVIQKDGTY